MSVLIDCFRSPPKILETPSRTHPTHSKPIDPNELWVMLETSTRGMAVTLKMATWGLAPLPAQFATPLALRVVLGLVADLTRS